jgi:large subunit ribosomal protein L3
MKMSLGLLGRKVGMTRVFTDDGDAIPVTVLDVSNNRVTQVKTAENSANGAPRESANLQQVISRRRASRPVMFCANSV